MFHAYNVYWIILGDFYFFRVQPRFFLRFLRLFTKHAIYCSLFSIFRLQWSLFFWLRFKIPRFYCLFCSLFFNLNFRDCGKIRCKKIFYSYTCLAFVPGNNNFFKRRIVLTATVLKAFTIIRAKVKAR